MGLDMYLRAEKYVGDWNHSKEEESKLFRKVAKAVGLGDFKCEASPSLTVEVTVAYWRKANEIHKWFVDNVQDGVDECQKSYVSREQLEHLVEQCNTAIALKDTEKMPTQSGFFFGSTDYDQDYWDSLKTTAEKIDKLLKDKRFDGWYFYYQSSW